MKGNRTRIGYYKKLRELGWKKRKNQKRFFAYKSVVITSTELSATMKMFYTASPHIRFTAGERLAYTMPVAWVRSRGVIKEWNDKWQSRYTPRES